MQLVDWVVLISTLLFIVVYGIYKTRGNQSVQDYIKGGNEAQWWTVGLSVMATQASAITFLSTPGQAYHSGMGFVQIYLGLPLAMIVICMVFIPLYHRLKVYTAYEFLENRFDKRTRMLTASLFLIQRGLSAGITIYAPAIILSAVLGWNLRILVILIGSIVILYTVSGGTKAVNVTQKQQMGVIFAGMILAFFVILDYLPEDITFSKALEVAAVQGKLDILDFSFSLENRYTLWSGLIGGTFLMLSYFGTDQSQVQRYLSAKNMRESQLGMLFNGVLKVPMQFFILLVGVMVFVFYQYNPTPLNFNPAAEKAALTSTKTADSYSKLNSELKLIQQEKIVLLKDFTNPNQNTNRSTIKAQLLDNQSKELKIRSLSKELIETVDKKIETNDKDYVFIHFILNNLPRGLIGLLLAMILSAAMSSTASELNALASTTTIDLYKRNFNPQGDDQHFVKATKLFTFSWGLIAILIACYASLFDNLIQLVNIIGSIFYGNVLGIFLLAFFFTYVKSKAVFWAAILTQGIVIYIWLQDWLPFLWLNFLGCAIVIAIALLIQTMLLFSKRNPIS